MGEVQLIASVMRGEVIDKSELDVHLGREGNLNQVESVVELEDEMEGFVYLQHLEDPIVVFQLQKALLGLAEDEAAI